MPAKINSSLNLRFFIICKFCLYKLSTFFYPLIKKNLNSLKKTVPFKENGIFFSKTFLRRISMFK